MAGIFDKMEMFSCVIEVESNDGIRKNKIQAPRIMIEQQFMSLVQQAVQSNFPVKIKISRTYQVYDFFSNKMIDRENYIVFANSAYGDLEK